MTVKTESHSQDHLIFITTKGVTFSLALVYLSECANHSTNFHKLPRKDGTWATEETTNWDHVMSLLGQGDGYGYVGVTTIFHIGGGGSVTRLSCKSNNFVTSAVLVEVCALLSAILVTLLDELVT